MFTTTKTNSGFAVDDLPRAREFYGGTLGLNTSHEYELMWLHLAGGRDTLVDEQSNVTQASYTILNFEVDDIDKAVEDPAARGVRFVRYEGRSRPGRQRDLSRARSVHRLVQGPGRQHVDRAPGTVS